MPPSHITLFAALSTASTEEDIKAAYIKAFGLKDVSRNLIDIQTKEIWFEAKDKPTSVFEMFAQLFHYVRDAIKKGEHIPTFLAVCDSEKVALMQTKDILHITDNNSLAWSKSASQYSKALVEKISPDIIDHFITYYIATQEQECIDAVKKAIASGQLMRTQITPSNLRKVFDQWIAMIGMELFDISKKPAEPPATEDFSLLFFTDTMYDEQTQKATHEELPVRLLHEGNKPVFQLRRTTTYELASLKGYNEFWKIYQRPPKKEYRNYLLERIDTLLPTDDRMFKGAFYTPLHVVDKAYETLAELLGETWQDDYIVWDMCCGVGNLEHPHITPRNLFMSTLDQKDIELMASRKFLPVATKFQYDYLNDDISKQKTATRHFSIDYTLTNKLPQELRQHIADANAGKTGAKKILVLINPPYAEATNATNTGVGREEIGNKAGVAATKVAEGMGTHYGKATNELFTQFVARIQSEIPSATLAMFSTLKYVNAPNFEKFREQWKATYLGGFVVHSKAFDDLKGNFPIGFLLWDTSKKEPITQITCEALDKKAIPIGEKTFYNLSNKTFLNVWIDRPRANKQEVIPLKNAITPTTGKAWIDTWTNGAIAYIYCGVNDLQHATQQTVLFSSVYSGGHGFYVTPSNLWQAAVVFSVRRLIKPTWLNDRDQFLQPTEPLSDEFKNDCLVWMLFSGSNLTAGADGLEWNNKKWSLVNHFIPFTEAEVGANSRFESEFMVQYLRDKKLSAEAQAVLNEGRKLWQCYYATDFERKIRDEYKLNRTDVGWYQIRKALEKRLEIDFVSFKTAYNILSEKLRPMVYELGFLR